MKLKYCTSQLWLRNSKTRIPFRYGKACLTRCPQAVLQVEIEVEGQRQQGYSGDCFPPSWFDKSNKTYREQIADMVSFTAHAQEAFTNAFPAARPLFEGWHQSYQQVQARVQAEKVPPLLGSFGLSLVERAVMDALCRKAEVSFAEALHKNLFAIDAGQVHPELAGLRPSDWLPGQPRTTVFVRHTVGLGDPLTTNDVPPEDQLADGAPQTLEDYVQQSGLKYFKIKVSNQLDQDLARLETIASIVEHQRGTDYGVTLDGNEQYQSASEFDALIDAIRARESLATFWQNVIVVEQPLERSIALTSEHTAGIRELSQTTPVIIDESDGELGSFPLARELGYRGVSSKSCKGPLKSVLNAGLIWNSNRTRSGGPPYVMTGEDLCTVGVIPVQSDFALTAALGLEHVERNGHHYHPGLAYLSPGEQQAAREAHPDFYAQLAGRVAPALAHGRFEIGSLQCVGFGFAALPDLNQMVRADDWQYESLEEDSEDDTHP